MDYVNNSHNKKLLIEGYGLAISEARELALMLLGKSSSLTQNEAKDFCTSGLLRRVLHICDCIERFSLFLDLQLSENWQNEIPGNLLFEQTAFLHSFFLAISGGLDNLAWLLLSEKK